MAERYALLIGINNYHKDYDSLVLPEIDVEVLEKLLRDSNIGAFQVEKAENKDFTSLRKTIYDFFKKPKFDDSVLFYFAGHGDIGEDGKFYFVAEDTVQDEIEYSGIEASYIFSRLESCRAKRQIVILDCCHSGEFTKLTGRGNEALQMVQQLKGDNGRGIIASSEAYQLSREDPNKKCSVFTSKIITGIETGEADNNPSDGKISIYELAKYVKKKMKGEKQTPISSITGKGEIYIASNPKYKGSPEKEPDHSPINQFIDKIERFIVEYKNKKSYLLDDLNVKLESGTVDQKSNFIRKFLSEFYEKPIDQIYMMSKIFPEDFKDFFSNKKRRAYFGSLINMFNGDVLKEYDDRLAKLWDNLHQGEWDGNLENLISFFKEFSFSEKDAEDMVKIGIFPAIKFNLFAILKENSYDDPIGARDEVRGAKPVWGPDNPSEDGFFAAITSGEYYSFDRNVRLLRFDTDGILKWGKTMPGGAVYAWADVISTYNQEAILVAQGNDKNFLRFQRYDKNGNEVGEHWDYGKPSDDERIYLSGTANSNGLWVIGEKKFSEVVRYAGKVSHQLLFLKYNQSGALKLDKMWNPGFDIFPSNCVSDGLGGIFITGFCVFTDKIEFRLPPQKKEDKKSLFLAHVNSKGKVTNFDYSKERFSQIGVKIAYDGNFIYILGFQTGDTSNLYHTMLWKFDKHFAMQDYFQLTGRYEEMVEFENVFEGHLGRLEPYIDIEPLRYPAETMLVVFGSPTNMGDVNLSIFDVVYNNLLESYIYDWNGNHDGVRRIVRTWFGKLITTGSTSAPYKDHPVIRNVKWKGNFRISPFRPLILDDIKQN